MVILCWRDVSQGLSAYSNDIQTYFRTSTYWAIDTRQALYPSTPDAPDVVTTSGHKIDASATFEPNPLRGSSIWFKNFLGPRTTRSTGIPNQYYKGLVHEIGHHLLGDHIVGSGSTMIANNDTRSYAPTAMEMAELGWITPTIYDKATPVDLDVTLGDMLTTGDAVFVEIDALQNRWFVIENHQKVSDYDYMAVDDALRTSSKGLYVMYHNDKKQHVQASSGARDWATTQNTIGFGDVQPLWVEGALNPVSGYTQAEIVPMGRIATKNNGSTFDRSPIYFVDDGNGNPVLFEYFLGNEGGEAYSECSSWGTTTNPRSHHYDHGNSVAVSSKASFFIKEITSNDEYILHFANDDVDVIPPSRVTTTNVPNLTNPSPVPAYPNPTVYSVSISWTGTILEADFDHFLITGGDTDVTEPTNSTSTTITITVPGNVGVVSRPINVYTVDTHGNQSCVALDGEKISYYTSIDNAQSKIGVGFKGEVTGERKRTTQPNAVVFPNPASDVLTVVVDGHLKMTNVFINDLRGYLTPASFNVSNGLYKTAINIDVARLVSGYHQLAIRHDFGVIPVSFVKQ